MRNYTNAQISSASSTTAAAAPFVAVAAFFAVAADLVYAPEIATARCADIDMSASTDGEDAFVVGAEIVSFADAEILFAADLVVAPACALRAMR